MHILVLVSVLFFATDALQASQPKEQERKLSFVVNPNSSIASRYSSALSFDRAFESIAEAARIPALHENCTMEHQERWCLEQEIVAGFMSCCNKVNATTVVISILSLKASDNTIMLSLLREEQLYWVQKSREQERVIELLLVRPLKMGLPDYSPADPLVQKRDLLRDTGYVIQPETDAPYWKLRFSLVALPPYVPLQQTQVGSGSAVSLSAVPIEAVSFQCTALSGPSTIGQAKSSIGWYVNFARFTRDLKNATECYASDVQLKEYDEHYRGYFCTSMLGGKSTPAAMLIVHRQEQGTFITIETCIYRAQASVQGAKLIAYMAKALQTEAAALQKSCRIKQVTHNALASLYTTCLRAQGYTLHTEDTEQYYHSHEYGRKPAVVTASSPLPSDVGVPAIVQGRLSPLLYALPQALPQMHALIISR